MRRYAVLLAIAGLVPACRSASGPDSPASDQALSQSGVMQLIEDRLANRLPQEQERTWAITSGNALTGNWLLQMPSASTWGMGQVWPGVGCRAGSACQQDFGLSTCRGDADCNGGPCRALAATKTSAEAEALTLCVGHSDSVLDELYRVITSAHSSVDVLSLGAPTGRFLASIRNAVTTLDRKNEPITVRFLFGSYPGGTPDLRSILADLTRDVRPTSLLNVGVTKSRRSLTSWNHSKIIAADGKEAMIGGMNLWEEHYLDREPVHDVSLHVHGAVAATAQRFANELWVEACRADGDRFHRGQDVCQLPFAANVGSSASGIRMLGVGRLGTSGRNPSDIALVSMMDAAQTSLRISQQDIGSVRLPNGVLPGDYLDAWIRAAARGVDITVVLTNEGSFGGEGRADRDGYSNGWSLRDVWRGLVARAKAVASERPRPIELDLCEHVHLATIRSSAADLWPSGSALANHAKVVITDEQAFYVGSQNLYVADLAEFGVVVDDGAFTKKLIAEYYTPLLTFSRRAMYVDPACVP